MGGQRVMARLLRGGLRGGLPRDASYIAAVHPTPRPASPATLAGRTASSRCLADSTPTHIRRSAIDTAPATRVAGPGVNMGPRAVMARDRDDPVVRARHRRPKPGKP